MGPWCPLIVSRPWRIGAAAGAFGGLDFGPARPHPSPMNVHALPQAEAVHYDRREMQTILSLYGRFVAAGEWRDYAIAGMRDLAVFSVFRRTAETPLYRIEKRPRLRARQQLYQVVAMDGHVLKRGNDLRAVLRVLERKLIRAVD